MKTKENECYTYFAITGDFDPDIISDLLCLKPDESWQIGEIREHGTVYDFAK